MLKIGDNDGAIQTAASYWSPILTRRPTDKFFIILLPINFLLWLGIGIYEMYDDRMTADQTYKIKNNQAFEPRHLDDIVLTSLLNITIYAITSSVIITSFLFLATIFKARWLVYTAISLIILTIVSLIMLIPWELFVLFSDSLGSHYSFLLIAAIIVTTLYLIYQVTIFVCTKDVNVSLSSELIDKSCTAILHSFMAILVSLVLAFLSIIVLMITINISLGKIFDFINPTRAYSYTRRETSSYIDLLPVSVFFIGGIYTFNFIWNFGLIIMADYSANFYAEADNQKNSNVSVFQSIGRVARYHLGTVAFLSTPLLPSICALSVGFKADEQFHSKTSYKSINFFSKLCLIIDISDYALVNTSIYGYKSLKSITEMFDLQQHSSLLFLTLNAISTKVIEICIVLATIIGMIIRILIVPTYHDIPLMKLKIYVFDEMMFYEIFVAAIYVNYICKSLTRSAMCTFSIYQMTSIRMSEAADDHIAIAEQSI